MQQQSFVVVVNSFINQVAIVACIIACISVAMRLCSGVV